MGVTLLVGGLGRGVKHLPSTFEFGGDIMGFVVPNFRPRMMYIFFFTQENDRTNGGKDIKWSYNRQESRSHAVVTKGMNTVLDGILILFFTFFFFPCMYALHTYVYNRVLRQAWIG